LYSPPWPVTKQFLTVVFDLRLEFWIGVDAAKKCDCSIAKSSAKILDRKS